MSPLPTPIYPESSSLISCPATLTRYTDSANHPTTPTCHTAPPRGPPCRLIIPLIHAARRFAVLPCFASLLLVHAALITARLRVCRGRDPLFLSRPLLTQTTATGVLEMLWDGNWYSFLRAGDTEDKGIGGSVFTINNAHVACQQVCSTLLAPPHPIPATASLHAYPHCRLRSQPIHCMCSICCVADGLFRG